MCCSVLRNRVLTLFLFAMLSAVLCIFDSFSLLEEKRTDIFGSFLLLTICHRNFDMGIEMGARVKLAAFRVWFLFFNLKNSKAVICVVFKRPHFPVEICLLSLWLFPTVVVPLWFFIWRSYTTNLIGKKMNRNAQEGGLHQPCPLLWLSVVPTPGDPTETLHVLWALCQNGFLRLNLEKGGKFHLLLWGYT